MKIKKLLLVCMSVVFITACTSTKVEDDKKTNNLKVKYSVEKISDNFDYLKSSISFPQFDDFPVLNKTIKNSVENYYDCGLSQGDMKPIKYKDGSTLIKNGRVYFTMSSMDKGIASFHNVQNSSEQYFTSS